MGESIKEVRSKLGLTQKQMAPLLGMTQQGVGRIETGYEGRKETNGHRHILMLISLISEHGLLEELQSRLLR
jgi:predicted transcriptional regulator